MQKSLSVLNCAFVTHRTTLGCQQECPVCSPPRLWQILQETLWVCPVDISGCCYITENLWRCCCSCICKAFLLVVSRQTCHHDCWHQLPFCLFQPVIRCRPRSLFRSPSMPSPVSRLSIKRPDCPADENTPVRVKRRRSLAGTQVTNLEQSPESPQMVSPHSAPKLFLMG